MIKSVTAMILTLLTLSILSVSANPFHKYPYVFLLDVGNEELEKVNTEQIRLSSPGGSVALRYPAIGNGDDIAHVRVSGIDFGTDLKANIVDGGPGYKYVVVVLMGNPGVAYDAVITIQTVPIVVNDDSVQNIENSYSGNVNEDIPKIYQVSEDENNSSEDLNDNDESKFSQVAPSDVKGEYTQESANVYSYVQNEEAVNDYDNDYESKSSREGENDSEGHNENLNRSETVEVEDYDPNEESLPINQPSTYTSDDDYSQSDGNQPVVVDQNLYDKYEALKDHLYDGSEVYSQGNIQSDLPYGVNQNYDEKTVDIEEIYDDYGENDLEKYRDPNNNFIDSDEASAVEQ